MSEVLAEAIAELEKLAPEEQELVGRWLMKELESERSWSSRFKASADKLSQLAAEVRADAAAGNDSELDPDRL